MQTIKDSRMCLIKNFWTVQTALKTWFLKVALLTDFSASAEIVASVVYEVKSWSLNLHFCGFIMKISFGIL